MSTLNIIKADYTSVPALSNMFIAAYANNEAMQAALRQDQAADFAHDAYWRWAIGEWGLAGGEVYTTPDDEGCVIMRSPGKHQADVMQKMELLAIVTRMMGSNKIELAKEVCEQMLAVPPLQDCYWLWGLGVSPDAGGKGLAGALIKTVTDQADAAGKPTYVVASSDKVVTTFERRGFEVLSKSENFPYWFMLRPAQG
ncbi:GNAT family N-acetyltransferase [Vibrio sp. 10N.222.51.C12]|uniref:GNAT family N-acetyltransferase n=1 Tax=unclassified Vibrio TaxID=2614977 RepID=UPI000C82B13B|nr:GNAT family N-acetyltransferase [Vibrio sp. 10N.286.48.B7]PMH82417.1 GNAT family N-acetyltransferase [Vibrio sp. 10N.286.48.B7]